MAERQQDLGKRPEPINLLTNHKGPLLVNIRGLGSFTPDLMGEDNTLFDYIGHTAAVLGTDMTTRLSIETAPEHWKVHRFDRAEGIIDVEQIDGEPTTPLDDDPVKFESYMRTLYPEDF